MSIRVRVVALSSAAVAVAIVLALVTAYFVVRSELIGQIDDSLRSQSAFAKRAADAGSVNTRRFKPPNDAKGLAATFPGRDSLTIQSVSRAGKTNAIAGTKPQLPLSAADLSIARSGVGQSLHGPVVVSSTRYRVITVGVGSHGAVMIARSLEGVDRLLGDLRVVLGVLILVGIGIAGVLGFLVARSITRPVIELSDAADTIGKTNDLSMRITLNRDDELGRLAKNFNTMLETIAVSQGALERSVESQRQLVADASHELRTPVSAVRTDVETVLQHPDLSQDERKKILRDADAGLEELAELINDVIELARGDEPVEQVELVRLDHVAQSSIERLGRLASDRVIKSSLSASVVEGRPDRIGRAINNLLDNAHKYSPAGEPITVSVSDGEVRVIDRGAGIPEDERAHLFDRFWRGGDSRTTPGSGLGLAIVRQVAETHGGSALLLSSSDNGSVFVLRLKPVSAELSD